MWGSTAFHQPSLHLDLESTTCCFLMRASFSCAMSNATPRSSRLAPRLFFLLCPSQLTLLSVPQHLYYFQLPLVVLLPPVVPKAQRNSDRVVELYTPVKYWMDFLNLKRIVLHQYGHHARSITHINNTTQKKKEEGAGCSLGESDSWTLFLSQMSKWIERSFIDMVERRLQSRLLDYLV